MTRRIFVTIFLFYFLQRIESEVLVAVGNSLVGNQQVEVDLPGASYLTGLVATGSHNLLVTDTADNHAAVYKVQTDGQTNYTNIFRDDKSSYFESIVYSATTDFVYVTSPSTNKIIRLKENGSEPSYFLFSGMRPSGLAINPCTRIIYWSNTARKNGSILFWKEGQDPMESRILLNDLQKPRGLAVDVSSGKLYWTEQIGNKFEIRSSNLDGSTVTSLVSETGGEPFGLGISTSAVYWSDWKRSALWRVNKTKPHRPELIQQYSLQRPNGVAVIPPLVGDCTASTNTKVPDSTLPLAVPTRPSNTSDTDLSSPSQVPNSTQSSKFANMCLNGYLLVGSGDCECDDGWTGELCQIDMCYNYCMSGSCSIIDGHPVCSCPDSYTGARCEVSEQVLSAAISHEAYINLVYILPTIIAAQAVAIIILAVCLYKYRKRPRIVRKRFISASKYADKVDRIRRKSVNKDDTKNIVKGAEHLGEGGGVQLDIEDCCNMAMCDTPCLEPPNRTPKKIFGNLKKSCHSSDRAALLDNNHEPDF